MTRMSKPRPTGPLARVALYWPGCQTVPARGDDGWWRLELCSSGLEPARGSGHTREACERDVVQAALEALRRRGRDLRERALRLREQADEIDAFLAREGTSP